MVTCLACCPAERLAVLQAQFVALYTVGHMALPDVMRAISIYMEYGSSQACQALAKRIAQGDLQELGSAQVAPQICAMYGLEVSVDSFVVLRLLLIRMPQIEEINQGINHYKPAASVLLIAPA